MPTHTKIAAVTGATGFVGKHLVRALVNQGFHVQALTRRPQLATKNVTWVEGDLENRSALLDLVQKADVVFHLAGVIKARKKEDFYKVNTGSVSTLIDIILTSSDRPHFILLSSLVARERHLSSYAESKRRGEEALIAGAGDLPWTILRPPGIYGPEDRETLKIFQAISWHIGPMPGRADNRTAWIYAPDLAQAMISVAGNQDCFGQTLDVDDGKPQGYSLAEIYNTASGILNIRPLLLTVPKSILKIFAYINVVFSKILGYTPMVTPEKVNELCFPDWICHGPHVMSLTSWKPETNLDKGFEKTLKWYKENDLI